jgi:hypothetical protein
VKKNQKFQFHLLTVIVLSILVSIYLALNLWSNCPISLSSSAFPSQERSRIFGFPIQAAAMITESGRFRQADGTVKGVTNEYLRVDWGFAVPINLFSLLILMSGAFYLLERRRRTV